MGFAKKSIASVTAGIDKMIRDLREVADAEHEAACEKRVTVVQLEEEIAEHGHESSRAFRIADRLSDLTA